MVHFGQPKNVEAFFQETRNTGRGGTRSTSFLSYQSFQLTNVETDIMNFTTSKLCRHKLLLDFFDVQCFPKEPLHLCNNNYYTNEVAP